MRFRWLKLFLIVFSSVLLVNCKSRTNIKTNNAIYYWQQHANLSQFEKDFVAENSIKTVYLKFFDVDKKNNEKMSIPLAIVNIDTGFTKYFKAIIPVVFITNRTFLNCSVDEVESLTEKICAKINQICTRNNIHVSELQFDCDWNSKTKTNYFYFLEKVKQYFTSKTISCTIRLHQIKYFKNTGIPNVDKGMLMFYNMGELKKITENNSILDYKEGKKYTDKLREYPLKLDLVLPAFSWGVIFRNNKFAGIWNEATLAQLNNDVDFESLGNFSFKAKKNIEKCYLYKNDIVRWEDSKIDAILKSTEWLKSNLPNDSFNLALFHLKEEKLINYDKKELHTIYNAFN